MQRKRGPDDGHASRVADIHSYRIGSLLLFVVVPLHQKLDTRDDALVGAHPSPAIFETLMRTVRGDCHGDLSADRLRRGAGLTTLTCRASKVNGTFRKSCAQNP